MPAKESEALRSMLSGGGGGGGGRTTVNAPVTHKIMAMDGASVEKVLMRNDKALMKVVGKAVRRGVHKSIRGV
jgi:hypothetical protein